ncbi:MAG TPA: metal-sensing transcriptional repressor [Cyclobacteriaceae bacterium]
MVRDKEALLNELEKETDHVVRIQYLLEENVSCYQIRKEIKDLIYALTEIKLILIKDQLQSCLAVMIHSTDQATFQNEVQIVDKLLGLTVNS